MHASRGSSEGSFDVHDSDGRYLSEKKLRRDNCSDNPRGEKENGCTHPQGLLSPLSRPPAGAQVTLVSNQGSGGEVNVSHERLNAHPTTGPHWRMLYIQ